MGLRTDRSILYTIYWAINIVILLTDLDLTSITYVSGPIATTCAGTWLVYL